MHRGHDQGPHHDLGTPQSSFQSQLAASQEQDLVFLYIVAACPRSQGEEWELQFKNEH